MKVNYRVLNVNYVISDVGLTSLISIVTLIALKSVSIGHVV